MSEKSYKFYGWEGAPEKVRHLYDLLSEIWCVETCAPRLRHKWSNENKTCGQCSITAFLVQDVLGGDVYGIPLPDGSVHCYNVVDGYLFDLTSEQFDPKFRDDLGDGTSDSSTPAELCYEGNPLQSRDVHFAKEEKRLRYELLKSKLQKLLPDNF